MSDRKPAVYAATGEARFGTWKLSGGLTNVTTLTPLTNFALPKSADIPEFETIDLSKLPPLEFTGTFEMSADEFERFMKPVWGYLKVGPHWFSVLDEPALVDGKMSLKVHLLKPDVVEWLQLENKRDGITVIHNKELEKWAENEAVRRD